jgi:hypothetical protein
VNDIGAVRGFQRLGDLRANSESFAERKGRAFQASRESGSFHILENEIVDAVLLSDVIDSADEGMVEAGDSPGLAFEAFPAFFGLQLQNLDGDRAIEPRVAGFVDLTHSAFAQ